MRYIGSKKIERAGRKNPRVVKTSVDPNGKFFLNKLELGNVMFFKKENKVFSLLVMNFES